MTDAATIAALRTDLIAANQYRQQAEVAAQDAIERAREWKAQVTAHAKELARLEGINADRMETIHDIGEERDGLRAERDAAREALKPFASAGLIFHPNASDLCIVEVTLGQCRSARAVINQGERK
jgi:chromosome segregation ATPase